MQSPYCYIIDSVPFNIYIATAVTCRCETDTSAMGTRVPMMTLAQASTFLAGSTSKKNRKAKTV